RYVLAGPRGGRLRDRLHFQVGSVTQRVEHEVGVGDDRLQDLEALVAQAVDDSQRAGPAGEAHNLVALAHRGAEIVDHGDVERATEGDLSGDDDPAEVVAGRRAADLHVESAPKRLRERAVDGELRAGADRQRPGIGHVAGEYEAAAVQETEAAVVARETVEL